MKRRARLDIRKIITYILLVTAMTVIASLTIGKDIYQYNENGLFSFAIVNFSGYLFVFLLMPMELAFVLYLRTGYDPFMLNVVAVATAMAAQVVDYLVGYYFSTKVIDQLIGRRRYQKAEAEIHKYGNLALFFSNLLPLSSPVISLAAGMLKYRMKDAFIFSLCGMIFRYLILTLIFG